MGQTITNTPKCPKCGDFMWKMGFYVEATGENIDDLESWACLTCDTVISLTLGARIIEKQVADAETKHDQE